MGISLYNLPLNYKNIAFSLLYCNFNVTKLNESDIMEKHQIKNGQYSLKPATIKKIINAAENPRDRLIIELLYYCGLRRSEVVSIQISNIDFERKTIIIHGKGNKNRIVPVPEDVISELKFYIGNSRRIWLFPAIKKSRAHLVGVMVNRILKKAGQAAGIVSPNPRMKSINPHLLRHSAARRLKDNGVPLEAIAAFLGHEKVSITADIYGLLSYEDIISSISGVLK